MTNNKLNDLQKFNRKDWLQLSSMAVAAFCLPENLLAAGKPTLPYRYFLASVEAAAFTMPPNKKISFDWPVAELPANGNHVLLSWSNNVKPTGKNFLLRLTSATDIRAYVVLEVVLTLTKEVIGTIDISYAHYMQPFEMEVPPNKVQQVIAEGVTVKMIKGTKPFWFFIQAENNNELPDAYLPHLLAANAKKDTTAWKKRLLSFASLSTFGWMEGCVLDGISMLSEKDRNGREILMRHLNKYFTNNTLIYESYNNERKSGTIDSVESILPFAMLALHNSNHPMLQTAIDFCTQAADAAGVIADEKGNNRRLKTEECYTISYPLAILAKKLNRPDLEQMAISNLQARVKLLATPNFIYQNGKEQERPVYGNWARGTGWYLLGLAKTLAVLPVNEITKPLHIAFQQAAAMVIEHQQPNGLFYCFLHRPETGIETSGSVSIAAALAYGYSKKLLPVSSKDAAKKCWMGLQPYLTPDGFLTGTSQVNKGGETLQVSGFRIISPYTLGFAGILEASLQDSL